MDPAYIYRLTRAFPNLCIASLVVGPNIFIQILACLYKLCHQHTDLLGHIINYTLTCMPGVIFTPRELKCVLNNRLFVSPCHIVDQCKHMSNAWQKKSLLKSCARECSRIVYISCVLLSFCLILDYLILCLSGDVLTVQARRVTWIDWLAAHYTAKQTM